MLSTFPVMKGLINPLRNMAGIIIGIIVIYITYDFFSNIILIRMECNIEKILIARWVIEEPFNEVG
jgi:hypothetical protein